VADASGREQRSRALPGRDEADQGRLGLLDRRRKLAGPPTWSPDGNRIAFETERLVYVVDVRHPELELIANGDFSGLSWDEGGIVASVR
jgi:Tol biopolymer transport system component